MSEAVLLSMVERCPSPAVLARAIEAGRLFPLLRRLERLGYVLERDGLYLVTGRGKCELELARALRRVTARAFGDGPAEVEQQASPHSGARLV
jgi:hypothetical protein